MLIWLFWGKDTFIFSVNRRARKVVVVVVVVNSVKEKDTWVSRIKLRKKVGRKKIENEDLKLI